jgi:hypothetical protein
VVYKAINIKKIKELVVCKHIKLNQNSKRAKRIFDTKNELFVLQKNKSSTHYKNRRTFHNQ